MGLFNTLKDKAIANRQRIVLPEGTEPRTLQAANQVIADGIADIFLIGDPAKIREEANDLGLTHIGEAKIIDPNDDNFTEKYAQLFYELRKSKGITIEDARKKVKDPLYLGCLIIKAGEADGQVAGAKNTTGNVLRAAFQVIKTQPGHKRGFRGIPYADAGRLSLWHRRHDGICRLCSGCRLRLLPNWHKLRLLRPKPPATLPTSSQEWQCLVSRQRAAHHTKTLTKWSKPQNWQKKSNQPLPSTENCRPMPHLFHR